MSFAEPLKGPLAVTAIFYVKRPKRHFRTGKYSHILRDDAPEYPFQNKKDADNYFKVVADVMEKKRCFDDDSQIVDQRSIKLYADEREPGVEIYAAELHQTDWREEIRQRFVLPSAS